MTKHRYSVILLLLHLIFSLCEETMEKCHLHLYLSLVSKFSTIRTHYFYYLKNNKSYFTSKNKIHVSLSQPLLPAHFLQVK